MLRKTSALLLLAGLLAATGAAAQTYDQSYSQAYDQPYDDDYYGDRDGPPQGGNAPPAGADVAYDYVNHQYYRYEGPPPQAPAAREQRGYRDGHTERQPLTGYYSGVRLVYPYSYYRRCGCYSGYGSYGHRHAYRDRYAGDDLDTQDYGRFSYNDSTRRYTDHHFTHSGWLW